MYNYDDSLLLQRLDAVTAEHDTLRAELARLQAKLSAAEDAEDVKNGAINNLTAELAAAKDKLTVMKGYIDSFERTLEKAGVPNSNSEGDPFLWSERVGLLAEQSTALAADNARLRKALEEWNSLPFSIGEYGDSGELAVISPVYYHNARAETRAALAATPAQSLAAHDAAVKVAVLREVANKFESTEIDTETREPSESYDCGYKDGQYSAVNRMIAEAGRIERGQNAK